MISTACLSTLIKIQSANMKFYHPLNTDPLLPTDVRNKTPDTFLCPRPKHSTFSWVVETFLITYLETPVA